MEVDKLIIDKVYQTPSGLGGLFDVKYIGMVRKKYLFKNVTLNWKGDVYAYSAKQVNSAIRSLKRSAILTEILENSQRN